MKARSNRPHVPANRIGLAKWPQVFQTNSSPEQRNRGAQPGNQNARNKWTREGEEWLQNRFGIGCRRTTNNKKYMMYAIWTLKKFPGLLKYFLDEEGRTLR